MLLRTVLSFCLLFSSLLFSEGTDLESCIQLRTKQYPIPEGKKILVGSPYRCGSTLIYNMLRFLFEDHGKIGSKVQKVHDFKQLENCIQCYPVTGPSGKVSAFTKKNSYILIPIRNPTDAILSCFRVMREPFNQARVKKIASDQISLYKAYSSLYQGSPNAYLLKYEDFTNNFDSLLLSIENIFQIKIENDDKITIRKLFNIESVLDYIDSLNVKNFSQWNPTTHFHGNHIATKTNDLSEEMKEYLHQQILFHLKKEKKFFQKLGYEL